jgi:hypothetical protein
MKKKFTLVIFAAAMIFASCSKENYPQESEGTTSDPPTYAASTQTWVFGEQTWSDAIHIPDCNKADFDGGTEENPKPDCHSYTYEGNTYYYYSWPYVDAHKSTMCPSPWRVPAEADFHLLYNHADRFELIGMWGAGAPAFSDGRKFFLLWSTTETDIPPIKSVIFYCEVGPCYILDTRKNIDAQVRCVK